MNRWSAWFFYPNLSPIQRPVVNKPKKDDHCKSCLLIFAVFLNVLGCFLIPYLICLIVAGVPVLVMEIGLGQYTSQGGITAWKICPIFQGKKSSKSHSSSGSLIHVLSLSTLARHEMSRSCKTHQFKEVTKKGSSLCSYVTLCGSWKLSTKLVIIISVSIFFILTQLNSPFV